MQITFHGAARTVTGSQHLLRVNGKNILLDCGLYQGQRKEANKRNRNLPFDPRQLDMVILSHAHIDHSGNIPSLVKNGFRGEILCTHATRDLCVDMLQDSGHIHEKDADFYNRKIRKKGEKRIDPLYTEEDALQSLRNFHALPYDRPRKIARDIELRFLDAGHMLGSAIVCLDIVDRYHKHDYRLVFSGDLGQHELPILRDPWVLDSADYLILESTYGNREHPPRQDLESELEAIVKRTVERGGALIIPSFAVGRTQQLVYSFQRLVADQRIPPIPIFVDSPLATDATATFRNHPELYDRDTLDYMQAYNDKDPFGFGTLTYTRSVEESKKLNGYSQSFIVISASGMCEAGRILHHLRNRIEDPKNTILFVGWQAPHTLGRRILEGEEQVRIFGQPHTVRAEIVRINGLSGHAGATDLVNWVGQMKKKPRQTFLVHGELKPAQALAKRLETELGLKKVQIPDLHDKVKLL